MGGAGGIGQPLCLLMAMNENVKELAVYDLDIAMVPAAGVAADLSHLEKRVKVSHYTLAKDIVEACGKYCPNAILALIVNPVNSVVPAMCELYKKKGLNPKKICGVTILDCVRANKFVHEITGDPIDGINIPVVCGHAGATILALFSQVEAAKSIPADQIPA